MCLAAAALSRCRLFLNQFPICVGVRPVACASSLFVVGLGYGSWWERQLPPPPPKNHFRKPWKFGQMLGQIKKIRAHLPESMLNSVYFITILHTKFGQTFNCPHPRKASAPYAYDMEHCMITATNTPFS